MGYGEFDHVTEFIDKKFAKLYSHYHCRMHKYYIRLVESGVDPKSKPCQEVSQDDWIYIIEHVYKDQNFSVNNICCSDVDGF